MIAENHCLYSGSNKDKDNNDDQGGDVHVPAWMFKKSNQENTEKKKKKKRDSKKKPAQPRENGDHAKQNMKVKESATEEKCLPDQL